jgi:Cu(I)/Ag(I) efflux system periplasmic protein CusF
MASHGFCFLVLGLGPIALTACVEPAPAAADATSLVPNIGIDLGSSARVRHVAGFAGEGEGYGRTEPGTTPAAHSSMPGMGRGATGRMQMDHGSMGGASQGSMDHGSMPGMNHGSRERPATGHSSTSKKRQASAGRSMQMADSGHAHAQGTGTVNSIDAAAHKVNVSHGPIPAIGFPTMTMDFAVAPSVDLRAVQPGTRINFTIEQGQGGMYVIQSIAPAGGGRQ